MGIVKSRLGDGLLLVVAIIFHLVGVVGIGWAHSEIILASTPMHLLLMLALLLISFRSQLNGFLYWAIPVAILSFWAEWLGVHYGWLFGNYWYGETLGAKWQQIPLLIAFNWVVVVAGAASISQQLTQLKWSFPLVTASLATAYDFVLEPVAMSLGFWMWQDSQVPAYNYVCWWVLSALVAYFWQRLRLQGNIFASGLFITQLIFFLVLRIIL